MVRERKSGFVFSLDAFVAFSLILIAVQSLLIISSTPRGYYRGLLQADDLAQDTLSAMTVAQCNQLGCASPGDTLMDDASKRVEEVGRFYSDTPIVQATDSLIPKPYSYAYEFYNFSDQQWRLVYNASDPQFNTRAGNAHLDVPFHRVQASAQRLVLGYAVDEYPGASPYCNVVCKGYNYTARANSSAADCVNEPCNVNIQSNFYAGDFNVGLLRLVVWG